MEEAQLDKCIQDLVKGKESEQYRKYYNSAIRKLREGEDLNFLENVVFQNYSMANYAQKKKEEVLELSTLQSSTSFIADEDEPYSSHKIENHSE